MTQLNLQAFNDQDVDIIKEYVKVMSPVARTLDLIQGEAQAYLGTLLPTIAATMFKLQNLSHQLMEAKVEDTLIKEREANEKDNISFSGSGNNEEEGDDFYSTVTQSEENRSRGHKSLQNKAQNLIRT
ncbi:hypothetical protein EVAR_11737_1 [Eumeta japonica]|uniref:Uncharacterized protein n=1 Tax=Eumeta variegata TaxID=151549 RepID=A0A4C1UPB3_EUMVA|nr:hypothetical protein EVAR_11737_1 [Eumeta japonica]